MRPMIVVVGAGAAGLMAAIHASGQGCRVLLLERTPEGGRKILISGGGRCNILPSRLEPGRYVTGSSKALLRKLLQSWPLSEQRRFFETELNLPLQLEEETGKLFPVANRARVVRDRLLAELARRGGEFRGNTQVLAIKPHQRGWQLQLASGPALVANALILTTGGLSVPQTGSDGFGLRALSELGHSLNPCYPALTPLTLEPPRWKALAGISVPVQIRGRLGRERWVEDGSFLFTHRGYSGPVVLNISHLVSRSLLPDSSGPAELRISWGGLSVAEWDAKLQPTAATVGSVVRGSLPQRLADYLMSEAAVEPGIQLSQLRREQRRLLSHHLGDSLLPWTGDEGYRKGEVTGGGALLGEFDSRSLESRLAPRLFVAGELLDAFGPVGGYNFLWAWATGRLAGLGAVRALSAPAASP